MIDNFHEFGNMNEKNFLKMFIKIGFVMNDSLAISVLSVLC